MKTATIIKNSDIAHDGTINFAPHCKIKYTKLFLLKENVTLRYSKNKKKSWIKQKYLHTNNVISSVENEAFQIRNCQP